MSRLVTLDPDSSLVREPDGYQFGKQVRPDSNEAEVEVKLISLAPVAPASKAGNLADPIPEKDVLHWELVLKR